MKRGYLEGACNKKHTNATGNKANNITTKFNGKYSTNRSKKQMEKNYLNNLRF